MYIFQLFLLNFIKYIGNSHINIIKITLSGYNYQPLTHRGRVLYPAGCWERRSGCCCRTSPRPSLPLRQTWGRETGEDCWTGFHLVLSAIGHETYKKNSYGWLANLRLFDGYLVLFLFLFDHILKLVVFFYHQDGGY